MATSGSRDFIGTRNSIIKTALRKIGAVSQGNEPTPEQMNEGAEALNVLITSFQTRSVFLWTQEDDYQNFTAELYLPLVQKHIYSLDSESVDINNVFFRSNYSDSPLLESLTREEYKRLISKRQEGTPTRYYLDKQLGVPNLYLWPIPENTTGLVVGTAGFNYICIKDHISDATNQPVSGADWTTYWEYTDKSGIIGTAWILDKSYYSNVVHFTKILRLQDFDAGGDNPDFPVRWYKTLIYGLAFELSHEYVLPLTERSELNTIFEQEFKLAKDGDNESSNLFIMVRR